ncbi:CBS domain-containing protein [Persicimonas caeni]|nr:CBS domain-containing protein [Persicimonas caeni]
MRAIITHANADLDALACLVLARRLYGDAICLRNHTVSMPVRRFLALHKDELDLKRVSDIDISTIEEVIVVDVRDGRRLDEYSELLESASRVVVWDHHPATEHDIDAGETHIEPVGACATLLCERLREEGIELNEAEATVALLGIYADTGSLSFDATSPRDVEAAAHLLRAGGKLSVVNRYMQQRFTPEQQELLVSMMPNTEEYTVKAVDIAIAKGEARRYVRSAAEVVDDIMRLGGHDAIFGVIGFDKGKRVQVVGRSRVPYVNVGQILSQMGGGGHAGAAAATFKKQTIDEVVASLKELLETSELQPTRVSDLMSSPVETIARDISLAEALELLERWHVTGAPVLRDGELEGIISRRDIDRAAEGDKLDLPVASHMSHNPVVIAPDEPIEDALEQMTQQDIGRMPVCDGQRMVGIISRSDILRRLYSEH